MQLQTNDSSTSHSRLPEAIWVFFMPCLLHIPRWLSQSSRNHCALIQWKLQRFNAKLPDAIYDGLHLDLRD